MAKKTVTIIGSGIAGTSIAYQLTKQGHSVEIFEKGPDYPYPHYPQFEETELMLEPESASLHTSADLKGHSFSGIYHHNIESERFMHLGGSATHWEAITLRMRPADFKRKSLFAYGNDWPMTYDELEPYYTRAEHLLGVSGTDIDNPFAPRRSKSHPLAPFQLGYGDQQLAKYLEKGGIALHTTPQARTSKPYDGRSQCLNYRTCRHCPIGARYSPNHHLLEAKKTGLLSIHCNTSIRRIVASAAGKVQAIVVRRNNQVQDQEHPCDLLVLAAGGLESPRLLMLSKSSAYPDGLGSSGGHLGQHLAFHHIWRGELHYKKPIYPGRFGGWTGQSHQFLDPEKKGSHGGTKVELSSNSVLHPALPTDLRNSEEGLAVIRRMAHSRPIAFHTESIAAGNKYLTLSSTRDRFGDPFVHIHYRSEAFDHRSFAQAQQLISRFAQTTKVNDFTLAGGTADPENFDNGCHHMGTCRMGSGQNDSVVNSFGQVHGVNNLFLAGSSIFVGTSGPVNPTLTIVALAIRTADYLIDQELR